MNQRHLYQPLLERTLENYQVQYLARRYDFGKESLVAQMLVKKINQEMDTAEKAIGIKRVKPFELYLEVHRQETILPLFAPVYIEPIIKGDGFIQGKSLVIEECLKHLRSVFPEAERTALLKIIEPWSQVRQKKVSHYIDQVTEKQSNFDQQDSACWADFIGSIKPVAPVDRLHVPDISAPGKLLKELTRYVSTEAGHGLTVARQLVEDVITLRNICCPRTYELKAGEMPMLVTDVNARLSEDITTRFRRLTPVIITVLDETELKGMPQTAPEYLECFKKRLVRVCFEAYRQNGLLTLMEMQWIFQISSTRISKLIRSVQLEHNLVVPTPGTILDAGKSMTHKNIIVGLHLEGYTVKDIAKMTHHSPRAVDNYIGTYEAVLILYLFGLSPALMARILKRSISLIREHLELAEKVYKDHLEIKTYLQMKGVKI